jgi:hypothetical protein
MRSDSPAGRNDDVELAHHRYFWCVLSGERETELTFHRFWRILQVIWRVVPVTGMEK